MRLGQLIKDFVQRDHIQTLLIEADEGLVQRDADMVAAALGPTAPPGMIDRGPAPGFSGGSEEVATVRDIRQGSAFEEERSPIRASLTRAVWAEACGQGESRHMNPPATRRISP